jgi:hypothetical protein
MKGVTPLLSFRFLKQVPTQYTVPFAVLVRSHATILGKVHERPKTGKLNLLRVFQRAVGGGGMSEEVEHYGQRLQKKAATH